jgi:two-component system sensor histidine kinase UhpB
VLIEPEPPQQQPSVLRLLVALNEVLFAPPASRRIDVRLARPDGAAWTLQWIASHQGEQREALSQLGSDMAVFAGCAALLLAVMRWNIRRSFRALAPLLDAIGRVEQHDRAAMRQLPPMPIRELDQIAAALRHLAQSLDAEEERRRLLGAQLLTLQQDERSRIARELHDELGQQLTALRVDAAWLQRRVAGDAGLASVAGGMGLQCARLQQQLRELLTRLHPLGDGERVQGRQVERVQRLRELLGSLVHGWSSAAGAATRYRLDLRMEGVDDRTLLPLDLMLTVYRISQEALTNVARHAQAADASLTLVLRRSRDGGGTLRWTVHDDGVGMEVASAWQRGNGLAGIKERVWAAGGDLQVESPTAGLRRGVRLDAELRFETVDGDPADAGVGHVLPPAPGSAP